MLGPIGALGIRGDASELALTIRLVHRQVIVRGHTVETMSQLNAHADAIRLKLKALASELGCYWAWIFWRSRPVWDADIPGARMRLETMPMLSQEFWNTISGEI